MKKALIVKCKTGLHNALAGGEYPGWKMDFIQDFATPYTHRYSWEKAQKLMNQRSKNYDQVVLEDPALVLNISKHERAKVDWSKMFTFQKEHGELELDRNRSKQISKALGLPVVEPWEIFAVANAQEVATRWRDDHDKVIVKMNTNFTVTSGETHKVLNSLPALCKIETRYDKPAQKFWDDLIIEPLIADTKIEFSVCGLANGKTYTPLCTLFDFENKLFPGMMGPKISDVSQIIIAGVAERWKKLVEKINPWIEKTNYRGWLDIDLFYLPEKDEAFIFEYATRFPCPTMASIVKLSDSNWLEIFHKALIGEAIPEVNWIDNWSISAGMFSVSTEFNNMAGPVATGAPVSGWENYWLQKPAHNGKHLIGIECAVNKGQLYTAGEIGRFFSAIGTGKSWRQALGNTYEVCRNVDYTNKVYKKNLFGYDSSKTSDSSLGQLLPYMKCIFGAR